MQKLLVHNLTAQALTMQSLIEGEDYLFGSHEGARAPQESAPEPHLNESHPLKN